MNASSRWGPTRRSGSRSGRAMPPACWGSGRLVAANPSVLVWVADDPEGDGQPLRSGNQRLLLTAVAHVGGEARGEASATVWRTGPGCAGPAGRLADDRRLSSTRGAFGRSFEGRLSRARVAAGKDMEAWMAGRIAGVLVGILLGVDGEPRDGAIAGGRGAGGSGPTPAGDEDGQGAHQRRSAGVSRRRAAGDARRRPASRPTAAASAAADGTADASRPSRRRGHAGSEGRARRPLRRPRPRRQTTKPAGGRVPIASMRRWRRRTRRCGS